MILLYNFVEIPFYKGYFKFSNTLTFIMAAILSIITVIVIKDFDNKVGERLKNLKHYSSGELITNFVINQRSYCCLKEESIIFKSAILFIGDSHIEQYIIALFNSEYKLK